MVKKRKKKKVATNFNLAEKVRRENELKEYGKILSLRPSVEHKSKKTYSRKEKHKNYEINTDF
jgi:hypothetical protein